MGLSVCCFGAVDGRERKQKQVLLKLEVTMQRRHSRGVGGDDHQAYLFSS